MNKTDIIIPVYRGLAETKACLESTLNTLDSKSAQIIVINDCSPESEITEYLREKAKQCSFLLLENTENLGFVATVNRGMSLNPENDILLLNSDVEVANNWLNRIQEAAYSDTKIGSITPFSNNATICSFPNFCEDNELFNQLDVNKLDLLFSQSNPDNSLIDIPTGVGFCMFIKRNCLNQVGLFDVETFGRGYGEENDWCQRAIKSGWRNVHLMNVFAFHKGGVSFADEQDPRKDRALELLNKIHPNYQHDVHQFINKDPAKPYRIKILLDIIAQDKRSKVLSIEHGRGGGIAQHVEELAEYLKEDIHFLRLTPSGDSNVELSLSITDTLRDTLIFKVPEQYDELVNLLKYMGTGHVHFHHTLGLPTKIWELSQDLNCQYDITIHDYYFINGSPTLTNEERAYCGDAPDRDEQCASYWPIPVSPEVWRENQRLFLNNASRVIFPSHDTHDRFIRDFPLENAVVAWHPDSEKNTLKTASKFNYQPNKNRPLKVLILGAMSREKGADQLEDVANTLSNNPIEFHLLGYGYRPLDQSVITHGPYQLDEVNKKISKIAPDIVWFPAIWPETYSYTLSIALTAELPVIVPNIGAFHERIAGRKNSVIMPWNTSINDWHNFFTQLSATGKIDCNVENKNFDGNIHFYSNMYYQVHWKKEKPDNITINIEAFTNTPDSCNPNNLGRKEYILKRLWLLREKAFIRKLSKLIPFKFQRYIKRKLSTKPIHEIIK